MNHSLIDAISVSRSFNLKCVLILVNAIENSQKHHTPSFVDKQPSSIKGSLLRNSSTSTRLPKLNLTDLVAESTNDRISFLNSN